MTVVFSWVFANCFFMSLLAQIGPERTDGLPGKAPEAANDAFSEAPAEVPAIEASPAQEVGDAMVLTSMEGKA
jgi:hypothetical protein